MVRMMKIPERQAATITAAVQLHDTPERRTAYKAAGHTNKRYRWDLLWASGLTELICDSVYPLGCNDDHIDTVLRRAVPEL